MARIFAIDDDEIICDFVTDVLENAGHSVVVVMNGDEAISKIELHKPDIILLDYNLPGQSGTSILQAVRDNVYINNIPIIMMTTRRSVWSVKIATDLGATGYLRKPFSSIELTDAIALHV